MAAGRFLYVVESTSGGIANYARHQIRALIELGTDVQVLCRPEFPYRHEFEKERILAVLPQSRASGSRIQRAWIYLCEARVIAAKICEYSRKLGCGTVIIDSFREYLAPLWCRPLKALASKGVSIAVVAHDPVRDFVVGPRWWHRYSIRKAYSFVSVVFVHDASEVDFGGAAPEGIHVVQIPHGLFSVPPAKIGRDEMRRQLGFDREDVIFLSFGQIRDGKCLDWFLEALRELPDRAKLLIAGKGGAHSQKPPSVYQNRAEDLGLGSRCHWELRYIEESEVAEFFEACDVLLLTYSADFRSASGVLSLAAQFEKTVLASSGEGPLKDAVLEYYLGVWCEPTQRSIAAAAKTLSTRKVASSDWERYRRDHRWERNARKVMKAFGAIHSVQ